MSGNLAQPDNKSNWNCSQTASRAFCMRPYQRRLYRVLTSLRRLFAGAVDLVRVGEMRNTSQSWREIGREIGVDPTLACRVSARSENLAGTGAASRRCFWGETGSEARSDYS